MGSRWTGLRLDAAGDWAGSTCHHLFLLDRLPPNGRGIGFVEEPRAGRAGGDTTETAGRKDQGTPQWLGPIRRFPKSSGA
jgi:hypothetical protein